MEIGEQKKKMNDLISVIVPVYKVEQYLEKCVRSIIAQDYRNIEIILVDDGSPDNCPRICDELSAEDNRIVVIHQENGGLSGARNAGISRAKGVYLAFVDSDDYLEPDYLSILHEALTNHGGDLCICNYFIDEPGKEQKISVSGYRPYPEAVQVISGREALSRCFESVYWVCTMFRLYPAWLFENISFQNGKIHEDEFILHEILLQCKSVVCLDKCLYHYVQRSGSITHAKSVRSVLDGAESMAYRAEKIQEDLPDLSCRCLFRACTILRNIYKNKPETEEQKKQLASIKSSIRATARLLGNNAALPVKNRFICKAIAADTGFLLFAYYLLFRNEA